MIRSEVNVNALRAMEQFDMLLFFGGVAGMINAAVQDSLVELRQLSIEEIAKQFTCSKQEISQRVGQTRAFRETRIRSQGAVFLKSREIPLHRFVVRQVDKGVAVRKYRSGRTRLYREAFGPNIRRLGGRVFRRKGSRRLPISQVPGVNLREDRVARAALKRAASKTPVIVAKNLRKHAERLLFEATRGRQAYGPNYLRRFTDETYVDTWEVTGGREVTL